jgi:erythronate-4-phosphate dehydrogenase
VAVKIIADANIPFVKDCFSSIGEVELIGGREMTPAVIADADCLLVRSVTEVNQDLLKDSSVRFVGTATIGFEHIDMEYLKKNNIGFASAPGSNANSVAEYIVAALLETAEKYNFELEGKSIGVVGVGNVGGRVVQKCNALGMRVKLNDPPLYRETGDEKYLPLEELFDCDFITLHTPLTFEGIDKTYHLADERFFKSLKDDCVFFNTSRGGVVDSGDLKSALKSGGLKAAVLDVWENEPSIDTQLLEMVDIGTAHIAGYSLDGKVAGMIMIYKEACEHFGFEPRFDIESFLPEPAVAELKIDPGGGSEQQVLQRTVERIYDIKEDDHQLRRILDVPAEKRGKLFDRLRKEYPVRREFQNTRIIIADSPASQCGVNLQRIADSRKIVEKLKGIGFLSLLSQE